MKFFSFILIFLVLNSLLIISNNNLHLETEEGIDNFLGDYSFFVEKVYSNVLRVTSNVIKLDWIATD
ncbi:hypothetical protein HOD88_00125 [archaeon]|jgi:hypothetical protein|nr:hypothetical protein [archaeon]